jgi:ATP-dependent exoDNAse (exonuclease V) beta subunit
MFLGEGRFKKPLLLLGADPATLAASLTNATGGAASANFGAKQVILVRDDAALRRLPAELSNALALTIDSSKGLEFDDVLLFSFFSSPDDAALWHECWRVLPAMLAAAAADPAGADPRHFPFAIDTGPLPKGMAAARDAVFDKRKHAALEAALKYLYVGATRAKNRLLIAEAAAGADGGGGAGANAVSSASTAAFEWLLRQGLAGVAEPADVADFARASTPDEWRRAARHFVRLRNWGAAATCFANAGLREDAAAARGKAALAALAAAGAGGAERAPLALAAARALLAAGGRRKPLQVAARVLNRLLREHALAARLFEALGWPARG